MPIPGAAVEPPRAETREPRGVCVAILPNEKPIRLQADSPGEFLSSLKQANLAWVNFAVDDLRKDGSQVASLLGFSASMVEAMLDSEFATYEDRESELALRLPVVRVRELQVDVLPLLILVRDGLVLSLHERGKVHRMVRLGKYADVFMRKIPTDRPSNDRLTILLMRLLNENNERNFEVLRVIQEKGDVIGANLLDTSRERDQVGRQVYEVKHLLVKYLDVLWASLDVIHNLRFGDAELITDDETILARVGILADDITRQIQLAEHTTEVLVSGLEVLQSIYNNQLQVLNNRLALVVAWLTILGTAILVPNTIATTLGPITSFHGSQRAAYVAFYLAATALATWIAFWFVRKRGLLRASVE